MIHDVVVHHGTGDLLNKLDCMLGVGKSSGSSDEPLDT